MLCINLEKIGVKMSLRSWSFVLWFLVISIDNLNGQDLKRFIKVETKQGDIRGVVEQARDGSDFVAFYGIPFAQPPVGELRWKPPKPASKWEKVRDATSVTGADECYQDLVYDPSVVIGSEDCLYLNVFTKRGMGGSDASLKKVLVWFHGGAFIFGGAQHYPGTNVMEEDIVLVNVQYRLNIFGFLSTEDSNLPGNYGMLDQVEALRWIQNNIEDYGGDPNDVTIFGMSAGGASVHYLTLSPMTKGLYKNAISLSGSALCWWANIPHPREQAIRLAKHFQCPDSEDNEQIVDCLQKLDGHSLAAAHKSVHFRWRSDKTEREPMNAFSPRSDPESENPFLPDEPIVAMELGHINPSPYMIGYTDKEGIWRANQILPNGGENSIIWKEFLADFHSVASMAFGLHGGQTHDAGDITQRLKDFYNLNDLDEDKLTDEKIENVVNALSDSMFNYCVDETAKLRSKHSKEVGETYLYLRTYSGEQTLARNSNNGTTRPIFHEPLKGAAHGNDMLLLFPLFPSYGTPNQKDLEASRKLIKLIIQFGKTGSPGIEDWKPLAEKDPVYLVMDEDYRVERGTPLKHRIDFWKSLPPVYWRHVSPVKSFDPKPKDEL